MISVNTTWNVNGYVPVRNIFDKHVHAAMINLNLIQRRIKTDEISRNEV